MRLRLAIAGVGLLALVLSPGALGAKCASPGTSGVSQYIETIPGAGCNTTPPQGRSRGTAGGLPGGAATALTRWGPAGRSVAHLVLTTGTAPRPRRQVKHRSRSSVGPVSGRTLGPVSGQSWLSALLHPILAGSASDGLGSLLPIIFGLVVLLALVAAGLRRSGMGRRH